MSLKITDADIKDFAGKVCLITGGASGIGWASARLLSAHDCKVVIGDLSPPPSGWESNESLSFFKTDVTSWGNQLALFKHTLELHGKIDIVCPNAGIAEGEMAFEDRSDENTGDPVEPAWSTVQVDLIGTMITVKLALHFMRKTMEGGVIIMTGSRASYQTYWMPVYAAAKHGVLGIMRALRLHTPQWNIRINMIAPSVTHTNILPGGSGEHYKNLGLYVQTADDVARAVAFLAQTDLNGKTIAISQGHYRELEDTIDGLKDSIWGEEDFTPSQGPETEAFLMVQLNRW